MRAALAPLRYVSHTLTLKVCACISKASLPGKTLRLDHVHLDPCHTQQHISFDWTDSWRTPAWVRERQPYATLKVQLKLGEAGGPVLCTVWLQTVGGASEQATHE